MASQHRNKTDVKYFFNLLLFFLFCFLNVQKKKGAPECDGNVTSRNVEEAHTPTKTKKEKKTKTKTKHTHQERKHYMKSVPSYLFFEWVAYME